MSNRITIRLNGGLVSSVYSDIEGLDIVVIDDDPIKEGYASDEEIEFYNKTLEEVGNLKDHY